MKPWRSAKPVVLGLALLALLACEREVRPSLLLLTLDTTRLDALGAFGGADARTPRIDALSAESLRFTQAVTTAPYTGPSHASMMTGLLPPGHGLRDFLVQALPPDAVTLAELLRDAGYDTAAFVSAYVLDRRYGLDQGFDVYTSSREPLGSEQFTSRTATETANEALAWLSERSSARPFFLWIHFFDPHHPYQPPPAFRTPHEAGAGRLARQRRRYLDAASYMDAEIGRVLDALDERELLADLIVVALADHGEMLGEHGRRPGTHSPVLYDTTLRVPLLVRAPGRVPPGEDARQVSIVDVFPTILELTGVRGPGGGVQGHSLLDRWRGDRPAYSETFYEHFPWRAREGRELVSLRDGGWKLVTGPSGDVLYDLRVDPAEQTDVAPQNPERVASLRAQLAALRSESGEAAAHILDLSDEEREEHIERLRSLGYVE